MRLVARMDDIERVARDAVDAAGKRLRTAWREAKTIEYKGPLDLVTETDREVEDLIVGRLRHAFPDHAIVAEEASAGSGPQRPGAGVNAWYLDPLDGTTKNLRMRTRSLPCRLPSPRPRASWSSASSTIPSATKPSSPAAAAVRR